MAATQPSFRAHYIQFTGSIAGRDKLLQLLQYTARFVAWNFARGNNQKGFQKYDMIKRKIVLTRKLWRIGKSGDQLNAIYLSTLRKAASSNISQYLTLGRQMSLAAYLFADTITSIDGVGLKSLPNMERLNRVCNQLWAAALAFGISNGVYRVCEILKMRARASEEGSEEKKMEQVNGHAPSQHSVSTQSIPVGEQMEVALQLVADICDLIVATGGFDLHKLHDGIVSVAGMNSSLIGMYLVWRQAV